MPVFECSAESGLAPCFRRCAALVLLQICCWIFFFFFCFRVHLFCFLPFGFLAFIWFYCCCPPALKNKSLGVSSLCFLSDPSPPGAQFAGYMSQGWFFLCLDVLVSRLLLSRDSLTSSSPRDLPPFPAPLALGSGCLPVPPGRWAELASMWSLGPAGMAQLAACSTAVSGPSSGKAPARPGGRSSLLATVPKLGSWSCVSLSHALPGEGHSGLLWGLKSFLKPSEQ